MTRGRKSTSNPLLPSSLNGVISERDESAGNSSGETLLNTSNIVLESSMSSPIKNLKDNHDRKLSKPSFTDLYTAEFRRNAKYHTSDRTLLVLLEEERNKYLQLEMQYHKVLQEVETLQNNHLTDIRSTEKAHESEARSFQKALVLKSEECGAAQKELSHWQAKYAKDSSSWLGTNEKLESHLARAQKSIRELEGRLKDREATVEDLKREKQTLLDRSLAQEQQVVENAARREKELVERMALMERELKQRLLKRDEELRKSMVIAKEKDIAFHDEKERRMKLEVDALQVNHALKQRDEELNLVKGALTRKQEELEQFSVLKAQYSELKKEQASLKEREKRSVEEISRQRVRETDLVGKLEELRSILHKQTCEAERLVNEQSRTKADLEQVRNSEQSLRIELQNALNAVAEREVQLNSANKKSRAQGSTVSNLSKELDSVSQALSEAKNRITELVEKFNQKDAQLVAVREQAQNADAVYRQDREALLTQVQQQQGQMLELQGQLGKLRQQLSDEVSRHSALQTRNKETLILVQDKIAQLQAALQSAQGQLTELRDTENGLRSLLRQRDDIVSQQSAKIAQLSSVLSHEQSENEQFRLRKQEEWLQLNDKFGQAKNIFENELNGLRQSLQSKQHQVESLTEELGRVNQQLNQISQQKFRAENKIAELGAQDQSQSRLLETLQQQLQSKSSECAVLALKLQSISEQNRRLDEEIFMYRQSTAQKDQELTSLQGNVSELTRRLKSQVEILMGGEPQVLPNRGYLGAVSLSDTPSRQQNPAYTSLQPTPTNYNIEATRFIPESTGVSLYSQQSSPSSGNSGRSKSTQLVIDGIAEELSKLGIPNFSFTRHGTNNSVQPNNSNDTSDILQAIKSKEAPAFEYETSKTSKSLQS